MSKKSRLDKQKQEQIRQKKLAESDELKEKEAAKHRESKSAKKMRRAAKRGYANIWLTIFTVIMLGAFAYSGFFWGGVTVVGSLEGLAEQISHKTAYMMLGGIILMLAGIFISLRRHYKLQSLFVLPGFALYFYSANVIINDIRHELSTRAVDPQLIGMDKDYVYRHYPIIITAAFSALILLISVIITLRKRHKQKIERDNAPVESIVKND